MPEQQLQDLIEGFRSRFQEALEAQLGTLAATHAQAIEEARRAAEADAEQAWAARVESTREEWTTRLAAEVAAARAETEQRWASKVESTRDEWSARLEAEITAAREEAERRLVAEATRVRVEAEQAAAEATAEARRQLEEAVAIERERAQADAAAERERVERELADARHALDSERSRGQESIAQARTVNADLDAGRLLEAMTALDAADSLSAVLGAVATAARAEAPRAAVFVVNGPQLEEWAMPQLPALSHGPVRIQSQDSGVLGRAMRDGVQVAGPGGEGTIPAFASLPQGRAALAVPLIVGGQPVAVLYADEGRASEPAQGWREAIQILGRHASACLAFLTAARTAQAVSLMSDSGGGAGEAQRAADDAEQGARRYARLLLSEIKMYNEAAVRSGRETRDLRARLTPEIDRARRLFTERIPASVARRDECFEQELVQTLADGDASLLGGP